MPPREASDTPPLHTADMAVRSDPAATAEPPAPAPTTSMGVDTARTTPGDPGTVDATAPSVSGLRCRPRSQELASLCARLYGRRGARNRALRALTAAKNAGVA